jgi:5,10-methylene-tetrahydrofolate dehydrogenase/methenyl tetrahydrofolate cyclohydrolase
VILVGNDPASQVYVRNKILRAEEVVFARWSIACRATPEQLLS